MHFYESLFILKRTYDSILSMNALMWEHQLVDPEKIALDHKQSVLYLTLFNHTLLEVCSFIEEYESHFYSLAEPEFKPRIKQLRQAASPAMKKIGEWKDLAKFRNEMIAHPWRKGKEKRFSYTDLIVYDVPQSFMQMQLVRLYISMIINLLELEFEHEMKSMMHYIMHLEQNWIKQKTHQTAYEEMKEARHS